MPSSETASPDPPEQRFAQHQDQQQGSFRPPWRVDTQRPAFRNPGPPRSPSSGIEDPSAGPRQQSQLAGAAHRLVALVRVELAVDVANVRADRVGRDA